MTRTEFLLQDRQRALIERFGLFAAIPIAIDSRKLTQHFSNFRIVRAVDLLPDCLGPQIQGFGFGKASEATIEIAEPAQRVRDAAILGPKLLLAHAQCVLVIRLGFRKPPHLQIDICQTMDRHGDKIVIWAKHRLVKAR